MSVKNKRKLLSIDIAASSCTPIIPAKIVKIYWGNQLMNNTKQHGIAFSKYDGIYFTMLAESLHLSWWTLYFWNIQYSSKPPNSTKYEINVETPAPMTPYPKCTTDRYSIRPWSMMQPMLMYIPGFTSSQHVKYRRSHSKRFIMTTPGKVNKHIVQARYATSSFCPNRIKIWFKNIVMMLCGIASNSILYRHKFK